MQGQLIIADARVLLPQCHCCNAPMRIRTIDVMDRQEQIKLACTACGTEMMQTYRFGK
jgi:predicted SprT family Zn-dependent metalloprotease